MNCVFLIWISWFAQEIKSFIVIIYFCLWIHPLDTCVGPRTVTFHIFIGSIRLSNQKVAIFVSLIVVCFFSYFFHIFRSNDIFLIVQVNVTKIVSVRKDSILIRWEFDGYVLVTRQDFHVPQLILICCNDDISFC